MREHIKPFISIVTPAFNEEANLEEFHRQVVLNLNSLDLIWEIIIIDDGSTDHTSEIIELLHQKDQRVKGISFARNFGNQIAVSAGLAASGGDAVVIIDADLQHPIELIPKMIDIWQSGFQVVSTVRNYGKKAPLSKRLLSAFFYKIMNTLSGTKIEPAAPDFKLIDRCIVDLLVQMPERTRYLKALIPWLGFSQTSIQFDCKERFAGKTSFNFVRLAELAIDGIISFTTKPLRWTAYIGFFVLTLAILHGCWALFQFFFLGPKTPGWTSIILLNLLLGGTTLISLGVIGEYIGRIYDEVKHRPLYTFRKTWGIDRKAVAKGALGHEKNDERTDLQH